MDRKEVLSSPEYWTAKTQVELYNQAQEFMKKTGRNQSQLAEYLGVSKGYVSQLLNGDYDHRLSKFFELALAFGVIPQIEFVPLEECVREDACLSKFKSVVVKKETDSVWKECDNFSTSTMKCDLKSCPTDTGIPKNVA